MAPRTVEDQRKPHKPPAVLRSACSSTMVLLWAWNQSQPSVSRLQFANMCSIGSATLAFGWILVIAQLAYLVILIFYVAKYHGFTMPVLRQSFHDLAEYGSSGSGSGGGGAEKPTELSSVPAPAATTSAV